jgi:hypothetical protein
MRRWQYLSVFLLVGLLLLAGLWWVGQAHNVRTGRATRADVIWSAITMWGTPVAIWFGAVGLSARAVNRDAPCRWPIAELFFVVVCALAVWGPDSVQRTFGSLDDRVIFVFIPSAVVASSSCLLNMVLAVRGKHWWRLTANSAAGLAIGVIMLFFDFVLLYFE